MNGLARFDLDSSNAFSEKRNISSGPLGVDSPVSFPATFTAINEYVFIPVTPGDYNQNGAVDAADYVVWRTADVADTTNDANDRLRRVDDALRANDRQRWRPLPSAAPLSIAVPEPATLTLLIMAMVVHYARRRSTVS